MKQKFQLLVKIVVWALVIFAMAFFTQKVFARITWCRYPISYAGRTVQSCKGVESSTDYWHGKMTTKVANGAALSKLGWYSWSDTRFCGSTATNLYVLGPVDAYNSKSISSTSQAHPVHPSGVPYCVLTIYGRVYGNHYWEQIGYSPVTEVWEYWQGIP